MIKPTLVILAAGMGSRYGGLKQLDTVGPGGETIMDYSVFDALAAGFGKIVFVIRKSFEKEFRTRVSSKFENRTEVEYVFQELNTPVAGQNIATSRSKPWGTAHAVLVAKEAVDAPFAVVNADDYYGQHSFIDLGKFLTEKAKPDYYAMVGYQLQNTLSDYGSVSRGVCVSNETGHLETVVERTSIRKNAGRIEYLENGKPFELPPDTLVSMNMWGFHPSVFEYMESMFLDFVSLHADNPKAEFFIPLVVNQLLHDKKVKLKVIPCTDQWYGVTYQEDKPMVVEAFRKLSRSGAYSVPLFS